MHSTILTSVGISLAASMKELPLVVQQLSMQHPGQELLVQNTVTGGQHSEEDERRKSVIEELRVAKNTHYLQPKLNS